VKYLNDQTADLDVDIPLLFDKLHDKAMECLSTMDREMIQKGKEYLLSMVQLKPDNYVALCNLACAESLLNNVHEALQTLEKSVRAGYTKLEKILEMKVLILHITLNSLRANFIWLMLTIMIS